MPNTNNEQRREYCSLETAETCLVEHCEENEIDLNFIPQEVKRNFIEACRHTPYDVPLEQIASDTGLTRETVASEMERIGRGVGVSVQGLRELTNRNTNQSDRFRDLITNFIMPEHEPRTEPEELQAISMPETITLDTAEMFGRHINDDMYAQFLVGEDVVTTNQSRYANIARAITKKKPKRSEHDMMFNKVRSIGADFPRPNFKDWSSKKELSDIVNDWFRNVEYREQWIFARREREGFNRRQVNQFSLDDVISRMNKRRNGHQLDTDNSKFYDWKLGGTDWTLRLELFVHEQDFFLISRYIHKPSNVEIMYNVRYWSEKSKSFKSLGSLICEYKNSPENFERVFGSHDELSGYYTEPYEEDNEDVLVDLDDWSDEDYEEEDYEDSPF
jgi:hypothetical protein